MCSVVGDPVPDGSEGGHGKVMELYGGGIPGDGSGAEGIDDALNDDVAD